MTLPPLGVFDVTAEPRGWHDETDRPAGWFHKSLIGDLPDAPPPPTFVAGWAARTSFHLGAGLGV